MCICKSSNSAIKNYVVFRIQDVLVMDTINANIINKATHLCYHFSSIHANVGFFFFLICHWSRVFTLRITMNL